MNPNVCYVPPHCPQVKVWFQNRRMKWKRVKGGQQGAAAREKELVNVKKGTLLPSEFSGIVALHHSTDLLANEDSHDSDQSSDHAHLWCAKARAWVRALPSPPQDFPNRDCCLLSCHRDTTMQNKCTKTNYVCLKMQSWKRKWCNFDELGKQMLAKLVKRN